MKSITPFRPMVMFALLTLFLVLGAAWYGGVSGFSDLALVVFGLLATTVMRLMAPAPRTSEETVSSSFFLLKYGEDFFKGTTRIQGPPVMIGMRINVVLALLMGLVAMIAFSLGSAAKAVFEVVAPLYVGMVAGLLSDLFEPPADAVHHAIPVDIAVRLDEHGG